MRVVDCIEQAFLNLRRKKLRTFLTTSGVVIGIGALVSMIAFGEGVQRNVTKHFREAELFNNIQVWPRGEQGRRGRDPDDPDDRGLEEQGQDEEQDKGAQADQSEEGGQAEDAQENENDGQAEEAPKADRLLDDATLEEIMRLKGVVLAVPEVRFPAMVRFGEHERFTFVQALPAQICRPPMVKLQAGDPFDPNDEKATIVTASLLRQWDIKDPNEGIGQQIEISTLTLDAEALNPMMIASVLAGDALPFSQDSHTFTIVGVAETRGMRGWSSAMRSDVVIPTSAADKMEKISLTNMADFFKSPERLKQYPMVGVRVSSPKYVKPVREQLDDWGFRTFAIADELKGVRIAFLIMDSILFAVGMIGITVASLGIVNTMLMSILERYREIGIMKAVGASDRDVKRVFLFESGAIGFLGGVGGLALGWVVSMAINQVIGIIMVRQGAPRESFFGFPWWLCLGAIAFSILISLLAGLYPTMRAARVDPVVALRHD